MKPQGKIFDGLKGYWRYKGEPFQVTTAHAICHHYRNASNPNKILDSLDDMAAAGFSAVEVYARYPLVRATPRGYDWRMFDKYVERAEQAGLKVFICLLYDFAPTAHKVKEEEYQEIAQAWYEENNYCWVDEEGNSQPSPSHGNHTCGALPCHPDFMRQAEEHVKTIARHVAGNDNVIYWILMGEFDMFGRWGQLAYDEFTREKFRGYLRSRYDLAELNNRWATKYKTWDKVEPPKLLKDQDFAGNPLAEAKIPRWDFYQFQQEVSRFFWSENVRWIKETDCRPVCMEENMAMNGYYTIHDRVVRDGYGLDSGNTCNFVNDYYFGYLLYFIAQSKSISNPPYQNNETQANCVIEHARRQTWFLQAMGGTGLNVWEWGGTRHKWNKWEGNYYNLVEGKKEREALGEYKRLLKEFKQLAPLLNISLPLPPKVGLFCPREVAYWNRGEKPIQAVPCPTTAYDALTQSCYYLLHAGLGAEVTAMHDAHEFESAEVLVAPMINYINRDTEERLIKYVENGGTLILGTHAGEFDDLGHKNKKNRLAELAGLSFSSHSVDASELTVTVKLPRLKVGKTIDLNHLTNPQAQVVKIKTTKVRVLAQAGKTPILTVRQVGKGKCVFWGLEPSRGLIPTVAQKSIYDLMTGLYEELGLAPMTVVRSEGEYDYDVLTGIKPVESGGFLLFLIEFRDQERELTIEINTDRLGLPAEFQAHEILGHRSHKITPKKSTFQTRIGAAETQIFYLTTLKKPPLRVVKTAPPGRFDERKFTLPKEISKPQYFPVDLTDAANRHADQALTHIGGIKGDDFRAGQWLKVSLPKAPYIETKGVQFAMLQGQALNYVVAKEAGEEFKIPVNTHGGCLHILGNSAWAALTNHPDDVLVGEYVVEYEDGMVFTQPLRLFQEIDFYRCWMGFHLARKVKQALQINMEGHLDLLIIPLRDVKVKNFIFRQIHEEIFPMIFGVTVERHV